MSCEHIPLSLPGLYAVMVPTLQKFLATLMVDRYPTASPVLLEPLRAVMRGADPDVGALRDALRQYVEFDDDRARHEAGFSEFQGWLTMSINALCSGERWTLVDACRRNAKRLVDYGATREEVEARWRELRG